MASHNQNQEASEADILCVQEVHSDHYEDFYAPELEQHGDTGVYKKTGEIYTGSVYIIDGCTTFFQRDQFSLVKKYEVGYQILDFTCSSGFSVNVITSVLRDMHILAWLCTPEFMMCFRRIRCLFLNSMFGC